MVVGLLFEVLVAVWQSRRTIPIPKIEPFDWEINGPGVMTPPQRSRPPQEFRPTTSGPAVPEPTSTPGAFTTAEPPWTATQVAHYLNLKVKTLHDWRTQHEVPPSMLVGGTPRWVLILLGLQEGSAVLEDQNNLVLRQRSKERAVAGGIDDLDVSIGDLVSSARRAYDNQWQRSLPGVDVMAAHGVTFTLFGDGVDLGLGQAHETVGAFGDEYHLEGVRGNEGPFDARLCRILDGVLAASGQCGVGAVANQMVNENVQRVSANNFDAIASVRPEHAEPPIRGPHLQATNVGSGGQG